MEGYVQPERHARKRRKKRDILSFRLDLAHELFCGFCFCERAGDPRSEENAHLRRLNSKRDVLSFRVDSHEPFGGFFSCERAGHPRSEENARLRRLNSTLPHWPSFVQRKGNLIVCLEKRRMKHLPTLGHKAWN